MQRTFLLREGHKFHSSDNSWGVFFCTHEQWPIAVRIFFLLPILDTDQHCLVIDKHEGKTNKQQQQKKNNEEIKDNSHEHRQERFSVYRKQWNTQRG